MEPKSKLTELSCEQVYNIWLSEPEVLKLYDCRSNEEYVEAHIPGAVHTLGSELSKILSGLSQKLAVLIVSPEDKNKIAETLSSFDNFVLLTDCHRWSELNFPLTSDFESKNFNFVHRKGLNMKSDIIFQQLFDAESSTYTYIIADKKTKEAAIIDPVLETVDRDIKLIDELGLRVIYALDTHIHADHITGAGELRERLGLKTAVSQAAAVECADVALEHGQELLLGDKKIKVIATPGHTNTCLSYYFEGMIFTGDALLIRSCGRTDFQQGSSDKLFHSVREKLFKLPGETVVYPAHDYRGHTSSTIATERQFNARLNESIDLEGFKKIMSELKLTDPKKIHEAVPANLACGIVKDARSLHPKVVDGVPEVSTEELHAHLSDVQKRKIKIIDVRRPDEFNNELGHIEGAALVTLGAELTQYLERGDRSEEIVFVCRSGARSATATNESLKLGYKFTANMVGGMIRWNENKFATVKN